MAKSAKLILIVDDEPDTATYLSTWLEDHGYRTCTAADGQQGLQAILERTPDLVLMDLKMPNQTGIQLYKEICGRDALSRLPVIFITGMAEYQLFGPDCMPLPDPVACIGKPPDRGVLLAAIERVLEQPAA
jgi:two-component system cell cycle response regulator DivK